MEIKHLRYFLAVAREENMTKAADMLHVTQPTLSKTLKSLEDELGKKLFTRHSFSISLTDEGMLLRDRAEDLIAMADRIEQEFITLDDITGGDIYFGLAESSDIPDLPITSPAAIQNRLRKNWIKGFLILQFYAKNQIRQNTIMSNFRKLIYGVPSCHQTILLP